MYSFEPPATPIEKLLKHGFIKEQDIRWLFSIRGLPVRISVPTLFSLERKKKTMVVRVKWDSAWSCWRTKVKNFLAGVSRQEQNLIFWSEEFSPCTELTRLIPPNGDLGKKRGGLVADCSTTRVTLKMRWTRRQFFPAASRFQICSDRDGFHVRPSHRVHLLRDPVGSVRPEADPHPDDPARIRVLPRRLFRPELLGLSFPQVSQHHHQKIKKKTDKMFEGQRLWPRGWAHICRAKLWRAWVQFPPGAGLFSSLYIPQQRVSWFRSLKEVQHYWFFQNKKMDA